MPDSPDSPPRPSPDTNGKQPPSSSNWNETVTRCRWSIVFLVLVLVGGGLVWYTLDTAGTTARAVPDTVTGAIREIGGLAERFQSSRITTTFTESLPEITSAKGGKLEVATLKATETFRRSDEKRIAWDYISLGTSVSEIRIPVTYRYHLDLDDGWTLDVRQHTCIVQTPPIRPSLPPAIHTDGMEKHTERGWLRLNPEKQMEALERELTPMVTSIAGNKRHLNMIREEARAVVREFIRTWLLREDHWREDRFRDIQVYFPDETVPEEEPPVPDAGKGSP